MRLSIRQEVALNRIVTELRETALSEALAEIELDNMLSEMEEYLSRTPENSDQAARLSEKPKKEEVLEETSEPCTMNDEVCRMLDEVERKLMAQNSDVAPVGLTTDINPVPGELSCKTGEDPSDITSTTVPKGEKTEDTTDTSTRCEKEYKTLGHPDEDIETMSTEEILPSLLSDMDENKTTFQSIDQPRKTQKRHYLSIFTRRNKNKTQQEMEKEVPISSEEKTKKKGSFLTGLKRFFCCCAPKN